MDLHQEEIFQHGSCIKAKEITRYWHTPLLLTGGCHCPLSPFGPNIECLERVSSFGRRLLKDLQEASKQASNQGHQQTKTRFKITLLHCQIISILYSRRQIITNIIFLFNIVRKSSPMELSCFKLSRLPNCFFMFTYPDITWKSAGVDRSNSYCYMWFQFLFSFTHVKSRPRCTKNTKCRRTNAAYP